VVGAEERSAMRVASAYSLTIFPRRFTPRSFYITCATDTNMIANIISKIIDSISLQKMKNSGIDVS